jgi:acyl carrier protein
MTETEIRSIVLDALKRVAPEAHLEALRPDEDLRDALDIDSMDFNKFVLLIHETTGVTFGEKDYPRLFSLGGCVRELSSRLPQREP